MSLDPATFAGYTALGSGRKQNEDRLAISTDPAQLPPGAAAYFAIFDGHGAPPSQKNPNAVQYFNLLPASHPPPQTFLPANRPPALPLPRLDLEPFPRRVLSSPGGDAASTWLEANLLPHIKETYQPGVSPQLAVATAFKNADEKVGPRCLYMVPIYTYTLRPERACRLFKHSVVAPSPLPHFLSPAPLPLPFPTSPDLATALPVRGARPRRPKVPWGGRGGGSLE